MTTISNNNSVLPAGLPGVAPAPLGVAPHEESISGGGGADVEVGAGTGAYFDADSEYYTTSDEKLIPQPTIGGGAAPAPTSAPAVGPTMADFAASGVFTADDLAKIERANLTPAQATELLRQAATHDMATNGARTTPAVASTPAPTRTSAAAAPAPAPITAPAPAPAAQPASPSVPTAGTKLQGVPTLADFEQLGIFTAEEITTLKNAKLSDADLTKLYEQASTVAGAQGTTGAGAAAGATAGAAAGAGAATATGATALTAEEQAAFPQVLSIAKQQLQLPEVREAIRGELKKAGMPSSDADLDAALAELAKGYETPAGARELMTRATQEGWLAPAGQPAFDAKWRKQFQEVFNKLNVPSDMQAETFAAMATEGWTADQLQAELDLMKSPEGQQLLKQTVSERAKGDAKGAAVGAGAVLLTGGLIGGANALRSGAAVRGLIAMGTQGGTKAAQQAVTVLASMNSKAARAAIATIQTAVPGVAPATNAAAVATSKAAAGTFLKGYKPGGFFANAGTKVMGAGAMVAPMPAFTAGNFFRTLIGAAPKDATGAAIQATGKLGAASRWLGPIGAAVGIGFGVWEVSEAAKAEGGFGKQSQRTTGAVVGQTIGSTLGLMVPIPGVNLAASVVGGMVGRDVGDTVVAGAQDVIEGKGWTKNTSKLTGAVTGAAAGAAIGAAIGAPFAGIGAVPGAAIGGVIGGIAGWLGGGAAGVAIHDAVSGSDGVQEKSKKAMKKIDRPLGGATAKF